MIGVCDKGVGHGASLRAPLVDIDFGSNAYCTNGNLESNSCTQGIFSASSIMQMRHHVAYRPLKVKHYVPFIKIQRERGPIRKLTST